MPLQNSSILTIHKNVLTVNAYSKLRQVPDNQEVYIKETGLTSIIFDITERVDESDVVEAIKYHLEDVAEKGNLIKVWANSVVNMAKFP